MTAPLVVEPLPARDEARDQEIAGFLDVCDTSFAQQTPWWRDVITHIDGDEPVWLGCRREGELIGALPAYRFRGPLGAILCSMPQPGALGGVVAKEGRDKDAVFESLLTAYVAHARALGCDLATVITNPFWPDRHLYRRYFAPDYALENSLLALRLDEGVSQSDELVGASSSLERNLRLARACGSRVDEEQTVANVEEWIDIHRERHAEIGATPLPSDLFLGALEHMVPKDRARFFFVRNEAGEMIAGGLYLHGGRVVDAFMPSIRSKYSRLRAGYLLAWHTISWAKRLGYEYYNWQASPPDGGVYRFKKQWGSCDFRYSIMTRVVRDATAYLAADARQLAEGYPRHFVLPYDVVGRPDTGAVRRSDRASAWRALEEGG